VRRLGRDPIDQLAEAGHRASDQLRREPLGVVEQVAGPGSAGRRPRGCRRRRTRRAADRASRSCRSPVGIGPCRAHRGWKPEDNQTYVAIEIYQGEHELASRNRRLGRFILGDLRPAPRGQTKVEVSFTMDADGILEITAAEIGTGRAASVQIEASSGLTAEEIERLGQRLGT
jgi:hypothetical protein